MEIVIFSHPEFLDHQSMPRYTKMLSEGMAEKGHKVQVWSPKPRAFKFAFLKSLRKWFGYVDQYLFFPQVVKRRIKTLNKDTLFVFMDHALGPWVPLVANRPHVIHCHDFLAQRSALGEINEHKTRWSGRYYQEWIRKGYSQGKHFISVSKKTKTDLHRFLPKTPHTSEIIYNAFNQEFAPGNIVELRKKLTIFTTVDLSHGYILHVGGNHWYKNRTGVLEIYNAYREKYAEVIPLILIGSHPDEVLKTSYHKSPFKKDIHFLVDCKDDVVQDAYAAASVLLFPSYEEGFGWPIAEAMASGCLVITTEKAPMTEVADSAGFFIPRSPGKLVNRDWAIRAATVLNQTLSLSAEDRGCTVSKGLANAKRFNRINTLDKIETTYENILINYFE